MTDNKKIADYQIVEIQEDKTVDDPKLFWTRNRILITLGITACIALAVGLGVGLGMKRDKDNQISLDIPLLKPPVVASSPPGLESKRRRLHQVDNRA